MTFLAGDCNNPITSPIISFFDLMFSSDTNWPSPMYNPPSMEAALNLILSLPASYLKSLISLAGNLASPGEKIIPVIPVKTSASKEL